MRTLRWIYMLVGSYAAYAVYAEDSVLPVPQSAKFWIVGTIVSLAIILFVGFPLAERFRTAASKLADPAVSAHNANAASHADIREALLLLNATGEDLQRQINQNEAHRRETMQNVQLQIQTAIELLRNS